MIFRSPAKRWHDMPRRTGRLYGALLLLAGCGGPVNEFVTIPEEEAAWRAAAPRLVGMPLAAIENCAGAPLGEAPAQPGFSAAVYRNQDLKNYCEVRLYIRDGRVAGYTADFDAPEYLWLHDGSNYCGRIFRSCMR